MSKAIRTALIAAVPIAILNLPPPFAIDVGLPDDANWFLRFTAAEWVLVHWPGLSIVKLDPYYHVLPLDIAAVFLSGYLVWALLLLGAIYAGRWIRQLVRKSSPPAI